MLILIRKGMTYRYTFLKFLLPQLGNVEEAQVDCEDGKTAVIASACKRLLATKSKRTMQGKELARQEKRTRHRGGKETPEMEAWFWTS